MTERGEIERVNESMRICMKIKILFCLFDKFFLYIVEPEPETAVISLSTDRIFR